MDRDAAAQATAVTTVILALLVLAQTAVGVAVTAGQQPVAVRDRVPATAQSSAWSDAPARNLSLDPQQMALPKGGGTIGEMQVEVLTNESHVAIRLTWPDVTRDMNISEPNAYSDAVALMLHGGDQPPIVMGATGTPVNIWYWRASWQFGDRAATDGTTGGMYVYPHPDNETMPGQAAGNPLSKAEYNRYGQNYYAKGYGSLSHAPTQNVNARGTRTADGWQVVFTRERSTNGTYDAAFDEAETMYLTVAAWNGSADEVNGQKSLSYQFLRLDTKTGELAAAEGGDYRGGAAEEAGDGEFSGGPVDDASGFAGQFWNLTGTVLAVVIVSWLIAYRSLRGENR